MMNSSVQMDATRTEMDANREEFRRLQDKIDMLKAFQPTTEVGKEKKNDSITTLEKDVEEVNVRYRSLMARLEEETVDFIVNSAQKEGTRG